MELEQTSELSASVREDAKQVEPEQTGPIADSFPRMGDVEYIEDIPTIKDGARMSNHLSFASSSASPVHQQPYRHNGAPSLFATGDDFTSSESSPEPEITSPKHPPSRNNVRSSGRHPKISKYLFTGISPPPSPSMPTSRVRAEDHPFPNQSKRATPKSFPTMRPQLRSSEPSATNDDKPPMLKKRKTRHHSSLDIHTVSNPKPLHRFSSPASSVKASVSRVDRDSISILEYDLDSDPTQQAYEFRDLFHERSPFSAILSARFIHAHLFERLSDSAAFNDQLTNSEGDLVTEFIEPAALSPVGLHDAVSPSYALDSTAVLGNSALTPTPGYGDLDLEGAVHVADPFPVLTMDDIINHQPWGLDAQTMIDPSILGGTPAFSEQHSPSPAPTPFRDFHGWKRARTPSPPPTQPALTVRVPPCTSTSNSPQILGGIEGNLGGGKARFYKKGTLQAPPHLSNSQRRRSASAKTSDSIHITRRSPSDQVTSTDSPLTEFSASEFLASGVTSTSSFATPSEAVNPVDEDTTAIGSGSVTLPRVNSIKAVTGRKQKSSTNKKGPYRIVAVNEGFCHQCRRSTSHPKMSCRACPKHYCILCIVKRYHDIEFHQFKKDFDCPACLDTCNCTSCCDKRREVYTSTRHIKLDKETMAKLLSGEIRSLPHLSGFLAGPREKLKPGQDPVSSRHREPLLIAKKGKMPARRKRVSSRRDTSDDDYNESDASTAPNTSVRVQPAEAALQTQRMLEESGSGRYWGAVYSIDGERIGMSYVGSNLQNVTVQTTGSSSVTGRSPSPSRQRKKRVYVGRWQDTWGFRPETPDDSLSEDEMHTNKRSRKNKEPGRARFCYVGNQNVVRAWRKARSKAIQRPPVPLLQPADDVDIHGSPSDPPPFDKACDLHEATGATPSDGILVDVEEDEENRSYWIMEGRLSPKKPNPSLLAVIDVPRPPPDNVGGVLDICPASALESCGQLVTQEDLVKAVASGLRAVGTTVLLPQQPPSPSPLTF